MATGKSRRRRRPRPYSAEEVYTLLEPEYGPVDWRPRREPVAELVETILSQHTSDLNAERAFLVLKARFPTWQEVVDAPTEDVADAIRSGGLAQQKAPRIQEALRVLKEQTGDYDLSFLAETPLAEAKAWLQQVPGIGPKTAAIVLAFSFGMPAMPVDTHVHRVSKRLGLIGPKVTADQAHDILERAISPEHVYGFHVYLITHGRQVCKAQRPLCARCVLAERCVARPQFLSDEALEVARQTPALSGH